MGVYDLTEMGIANGKEPKAIKDGSEVQLRIIDVTEDSDKNGHDYIMPRFEVVNEPLAKDFTKFLHIPDKEWMDPKKLNSTQWDMQNFLTCFGMDVSGRVNFRDQLPGKTGWVILGSKDDPEYGTQNYIKKYLHKR